jgi:hypothetical protein
VRRALLALVFVAAAGGAAHADMVPHGRLALVGGGRGHLGELSSEYGAGLMYGVQAAWEPMKDHQKLGYVLVWDVLFGWFGNDSAAITGTLDEVEMSFGARLRYATGDDPKATFLLGGGGSLLRANIELPPRDKRAYGAGYGAIGMELLVGGKVLTSLEFRYGLIGDGPQELTLLATAGFGI